MSQDIQNWLSRRPPPGLAKRHSMKESLIGRFGIYEEIDNRRLLKELKKYYQQSYRSEDRAKLQDNPQPAQPEDDVNGPTPMDIPIRNNTLLIWAKRESNLPRTKLVIQNQHCIGLRDTGAEISGIISTCDSGVDHDLIIGWDINVSLQGQVDGKMKTVNIQFNYNRIIIPTTQDPQTINAIAKSSKDTEFITNMILSELKTVWGKPISQKSILLEDIIRYQSNNLKYKMTYKCYYDSMIIITSQMLEVERSHEFLNEHGRPYQTLEWCWERLRFALKIKKKSSGPFLCLENTKKKTTGPTGPTGPFLCLENTKKKTTVQPVQLVHFSA
ncbi:hypothetical protein BDF20DRAFT_834958 [Mycotypha africana]|uniref:uncharacterized protein n=1 Tax=Mycotypha africana TaxID=64632 RepID=UPI002300B17F|nr:uncharacterized protein BDF20DRAFT_834958 [Mycotypha africana]KAI8982323.1 hypothetical protein BDF20DRAFT_834958 [Mycotypha africana]